MRPLMIAFLLLALTSCKKGDLISPTEQIPKLKATDVVDSVLYELSISKANWSAADTLKAEFKLTNQALIARTFNFSYYEQWTWCVLNDSEKIVMFYPRSFSPAESRFTLNPTESKTYSLSQKIADDAGNAVRAGSYTLRASLRHLNSASLSLGIAIGGVVQSIAVQMRNTDTYQYATVGGDEESARITFQAQHYSVSEIRRNAATKWIAVYFYQPKTGYVGSDHAEIEIQTGSDGASPPTNIKTVAFDFMISN